MATKTTHSPLLGIRVPRAVSDGIRRVAKSSGLSITEVVLNDLKPYDTYGSADGQAARQRIMTVLSDGTSTVQSTPSGVLSHEDDSWWYDIQLHRYVDGDTSTWEHRIVQTEKTTREQALIEYGDTLWGQWYALSAPEREMLLTDLETTGRHVFRMGYARFSQWLSFPDEYELDLHWRMFATGEVGGRTNFTKLTPSTEDEFTFCSWASLHLSNILNEYRLRGGQAGGYVYSPQHPDGWAYRIKYYSNRSDAENVSYWVGLWLNEYRNLSITSVGDVDVAFAKHQYFAHMTINIDCLQTTKNLKTS